MSTKTNKIIYWIATVIVAFILGGSAIGKLTGGDQAAQMAPIIGGAAKVTYLGILELAIVGLWFIKRTGVLGALLAIAYMGGAIAVHFVNDLPLTAPVIIQAIVWIAAAFRFPELPQRLFNYNTRN